MVRSKSLFYIGSRDSAFAGAPLNSTIQLTSNWIGISPSRQIARLRPHPFAPRERLKRCRLMMHSIKYSVVIPTRSSKSQHLKPGFAAALNFLYSLGEAGKSPSKFGKLGRPKWLGRELFQAWPPPGLAQVRASRPGRSPARHREFRIETWYPAGSSWCASRRMKLQSCFQTDRPSVCTRSHR